MRATSKNGAYFIFLSTRTHGGNKTINLSSNNFHDTSWHCINILAAPFHPELYQTRPKIDAGDASLLMGSINWLISKTALKCWSVWP